jgi:methionyl-tRNA synthetase
MREQLVDEPGADQLDAVLALVLAAWALTRRDTNWGLPVNMDPLEGWIVGA